MGIASEGNQKAAGDSVELVSVGDSLLRDIAHDQAFPFHMLLAKFRTNGRGRAIRAKGDMLGQDFGCGGEDGLFVRFRNRLKCGQSPAQTLGKQLRNVALPVNGRQSEREDGKKSHADRLENSRADFNPHNTESFPCPRMWIRIPQNRPISAVVRVIKSTLILTSGPCLRIQSVRREGLLLQSAALVLVSALTYKYLSAEPPLSHQSFCQMPERLYDLADQLYRVAPWAWMREAQLVGLRHPETGEIAHISIMGRDGIHFCLALYLEPESLHRFNLIQEAEYEGITLSEEDTIGLIFESRQLQASFNPRSELEPRELAEIKRLGRKYRGKNWPAFRSFHPGRAPGQLSANDAVWLAHAIEQLVQVAPILNDDPFGDYRAGANGVTEILTRERRDGKWETTWTPFDKQLFEFPTPAPGSFLATKVAGHSTLPDIECHFQLIPSPGTGNDLQRYCRPFKALFHCGHLLHKDVLLRVVLENENTVILIIQDNHMLPDVKRLVAALFKIVESIPPRLQHVISIAAVKGI